MNKPLVSVHMITYNHEAYLKQAIESVLSQKADFDIEIVIGEDCSTDNTLAICEEYAGKFPNIVRLIKREHNYGSAENFFDLFSHCRGKYIATCEGDDYWIDPYKLQKQINLLEIYPEASMSVALIKTLNNTEETLEPPYTNETFPLVYQNGLNKYFHTSTYVLRNSFLKVVLKSHPTLFINDTSLCFLMINMGPFVVLNEVVSTYRVTHNGIWTGINQLKKDYLHYKLHNAFRKHHVLKRYSFHLKWEKKFLDILTDKDNEYRSKLRFKKLYVDTVFYAIKAFNKLKKLFRF